MVRRHPLSAALPVAWFFTDERLSLPVERVAAALPPGSGIVVRHDRLVPGARWRLVRRLAAIARARGHILLLAGTPETARRWGADGVHLRQRDARHAAQARRNGLIVSMPVHDGKEARRTQRAGVMLAFVSPLYPTRSHPGAPALGTAKWARLARASGAGPAALGGMTRGRARRLQRQVAAQGMRVAWAAIGAWEDKALARQKRQKRNAVPT
jgi:thiamine-phosphate pyrophosphorylase